MITSALRSTAVRHGGAPTFTKSMTIGSHAPLYRTPSLKRRIPPIRSKNVGYTEVYPGALRGDEASTGQIKRGAFAPFAISF